MADFKVTAKSEPTVAKFFIGRKTGSLFVEDESGNHICVVAKGRHVVGKRLFPGVEVDLVPVGSTLTIEV